MLRLLLRNGDYNEIKILLNEDNKSIISFTQDINSTNIKRKAINLIKIITMKVPSKYYSKIIEKSIKTLK